MLNKVVIMGRLTRDPELRTVNNDVSVCSFSVACDRDIVSKGSNERETDFFDVTAWRGTADFVSKYFTRGRMIVVVGRLQRRNYTDKDGNKRTATDIIAENVYFGDSKSSSDSGNSAAGAAAPKSDHPMGGQSSNYAQVEDEDGELPF